MSIIWPWAARRAVEAYKAEADRLHEMNSSLEQKLAVEKVRSQNVIKDMELRGRIMQSQIERLEDQLRTAHFRDPKTGRIGPRGRRFQ